MATPKMTPEQRSAYNAVRTWAKDIGNTEWHQANDQQQPLFPLKEINDPNNWDRFLNNVLNDMARTGGPELAEYFQRAAERSRKTAWKAHEKGEPDCAECIANQHAQIKDAMRFFGGNP